MPGLAFINKLRPITYTLDATGLDKFLNKSRAYETELNSEAKAVMDKGLKEKERVVETGFIAQEVEAAAKELRYDFSGVTVPKNENEIYGLKYTDFVVPLVKAVQELSKKNEELEERIKKLEALVNKNGSNASTIAVDLHDGYIEQNTPNPYGNSTTIRYFVPLASSSASLVITDAAGKMIKTVNISSKGNGQVKFNSASLAAGNYNYSLWIDGRKVDSKVMVIER